MPKISKKSKGKKEAIVAADPVSDEEAIDFNQMNIEKEEETFTFDYIEPNHKYDFTLINYLRKSFNFVSWNILTLSEGICEQNELGMLLAIENETGTTNPDPQSKSFEIYGILSVVSFDKINKDSFADLMIDTIVKHAPENSKELLLNYKSAQNKLGLLVNDRIINLPESICEVMYEQLLEDYNFIKTEYTIEEIEEYELDFIVHFIPVEEKAKGSNHEKNNGLNNSLFYRQEDKHFLKKSFYHFEIPHNLSDQYKILCAIIKFDDFITLMSNGNLFK